MSNSISTRFAVAAVFVLLACVGLLSHSVSLALISISVSIFLVPRDAPDLSDSAMRRWLLGAAIRLVIALVVVGIVYFQPLLTAAAFQRILFHPGFVLAYGALGLWSLFRNWRKQKGKANA